jgi:hypothetical protein
MNGTAQENVAATPPPSRHHWELGVSLEFAVQPCRDQCPLVTQWQGAVKEDDPWHPRVLTVRAPCSSGRDMGWGALMWPHHSDSSGLAAEPGMPQGWGNKSKRMGCAGLETWKGRRKTLNFPEACQAWSRETCVWPGQRPPLKRSSNAKGSTRNTESLQWISLICCISP